MSKELIERLRVFAGDPVHKGRTVAVVTCCKNEAAE